MKPRVLNRGGRSETGNRLLDRLPREEYERGRSESGNRLLNRLPREEYERGRSESGNRLLDRLPREEYERLVPLLELVHLAAEQKLYGVNDPIPHVYFPKTGMVSVVILLQDGRQVESGTVGNEGLVGLPVVLGFGFSTHQVMCQVPGDSLRLAVSPFMEAVKGSPQLYALLQRYVALSLRTTAQIVACNALHPVLERLCRWLLMIHDRVATEAFQITQEFLAEMLGVRRQTISIIAGTLQKAGLVTYRRGVVRILNRKGLEEGACECYEAMKASYDQICGITAPEFFQVPDCGVKDTTESKRKLQGGRPCKYVRS